VIGETMAVMMVTGTPALIPHSFLQPVRTLTATVAAEMGETVKAANIMPHSLQSASSYSSLLFSSTAQQICIFIKRRSNGTR